MKTTTVRLRVIFEDRHLLTKTQRSEGLKRSWILLKPESETISDLTAYLIHSFDLHHSCPNGIRISMDGFVLPYYESTRVFKDKDIIRVKRNKIAAINAIVINGDANCPEYTDLVEKRPLLTGMKLLALEEFEKETGGYQSEPEELENDSPVGTMLAVAETTSSGKRTSKKRKSHKQMHTSKKKKIKLTCPENSSDIPSKGAENHIHVKDQPGHHKEVVSQKSLLKDSTKTSFTLKKASNAEVGQRIEDDVREMATQKSCGNLPASGEKDIEDVAPEGSKKGPSRSARRKKAKRKWLRELVNSQKEELDQSIPAKVVLDNSQEHQKSEGKDDTEVEIVPVVVRPGHIRFEPLDKDSDQVSQPTHNPKENFQWNGITSKRKGQKWGMEKGSVSWSNGHADLRGDSIEPESNQWNNNSITNKRSKQNKVIVEENNSTPKKMDIDEIVEKQNVQERELPHGPVDFEKLNPLTRPPKEGDVIAYRLVELSSTWCPELSDFRVGKVAWFDFVTNVIMLVPVPDYPIVSNEKKDESISFDENQDEAEAVTTQESDTTSQYFEDGTLEIDFASLVDVRTLNNDKSNPETVTVTALNNDKSSPETVTAVSNKSVSNDQMEETSVRVTAENGGSKDDVWEEISQVLSEKKTQLSKGSEDGWTQNEKEKQSSGKKDWSYKSLRSGGLGAIMSRLRSGNNL